MSAGFQGAFIPSRTGGEGFPAGNEKSPLVMIIITTPGAAGRILLYNWGNVFPAVRRYGKGPLGGCFLYAITGIDQRGKKAIFNQMAHELGCFSAKI